MMEDEVKTNHSESFTIHANNASEIPKRILKILNDNSNEMKISMIVAMSKNRAIGKDNKLLWHLPSDLKYFKEKTQGKVVLMGRKTFESIGKPLPNRINIVLTSDKNYLPESFVNLESKNFDSGSLIVTNSLEKLETYLHDKCDELFIIGGATLYEQYMSRANTVYITEVDVETEGDTHFPYLNSDLKLIETSEVISENGYNFKFCKYEK